MKKANSPRDHKRPASKSTGRPTGKPKRSTDDRKNDSESDERPFRARGNSANKTDRPKRQGDDKSTDRTERPYRSKSSDSAAGEKPKWERKDESSERTERPYRAKNNASGPNDRPKRERNDEGNERSDRPFRSKNSTSGPSDRPKRERNEESSARNERPYRAKNSTSGAGDRPPRERNDEDSERNEQPFRPKRDTGDRPSRTSRDTDNSSEENRDKPYWPNTGKAKPSRKYTPRPGDGSAAERASSPDKKPRRKNDDNNEVDHRGKPVKKPFGEIRERAERPAAKSARPVAKSKDAAPFKRAAPKPKKPRPTIDDIDNDEEEDLEDDVEEAEAPKRRKLSWKQEEALANVKVKEPVKEEKMPLNKYLAHAGLCSRREAATIVKEGTVRVNGVVVKEPGYKVEPDDVITVNEKKMTPQKGLVYILLNKPKDYITTNEDPQGRRTVMELVEGADADRLFPVGRLDRHTTGLLLITNDGDLTQQLSHPAFNIKKVYQVTLDKALTKADFDSIAEGLELEDGPVKVDAIAFLDKKTEIGIEIHSGRNRIVRRIFEHLGYVVEKLDRVMYAGLTKKNIPRGKWRYLSEKEIIFLKHFKGQKSSQ